MRLHPGIAEGRDPKARRKYESGIDAAGIGASGDIPGRRIPHHRERRLAHDGFGIGLGQDGTGIEKGRMGVPASARGIGSGIAARERNE